MKEINNSLLDGHPNPEGYLEWCEGLSDEEFMAHFQQKRYPQGKMSDDDEDELIIKIAADPENEVVRIDFGKPIKWLAFEANIALEFSRLITTHALSLLPDKGGEQDATQVKSSGEIPER